MQIWRGLWQMSDKSKKNFMLLAQRSFLKNWPHNFLNIVIFENSVWTKFYFTLIYKWHKLFETGSQVFHAFTHDSVWLFTTYSSHARFLSSQLSIVIWTLLNKLRTCEANIQDVFKGVNLVIWSMLLRQCLCILWAVLFSPSSPSSIFPLWILQVHPTISHVYKLLLASMRASMQNRWPQ
jgi:hypothetical protein